ncbi:MAG TPA: phosphate-starvation-inducible PsiE family protein [Anaeromyxobacteraceae bacterium]|nr:phosphate-starvation-inducible PsiE family protein [Anaeromyxobacteraceae bacterium]
MERRVPQPRMRAAVSTVFARVQDLVYVGLGVLLGLTAIVLLVRTGIALTQAVLRADVEFIVSLLDRTLLTLMIVELLYTVQVSFGEHVLRPEPFILVALIAAVRRILVISAELGAETKPEDLVFKEVMLELGILTVLIVALVGSLVVLRRHAIDEDIAPAAHRAGKPEGENAEDETGGADRKR